MIIYYLVKVGCLTTNQKVGNTMIYIAECYWEVVENKVVGDTGFEPVTSTV